MAPESDNLKPSSPTRFGEWRHLFKDPEVRKALLLSAAIALEPLLHIAVIIIAAIAAIVLLLF